MEHISLDLCLWPYDGELKKHPGQQPLKFRLKIEGHRNPYFKGTGYYLSPDQFDEDKQEILNHPKAKFYNSQLTKRIREYEIEIEKKQAFKEPITKDFFKKEKKIAKFFEFCKAVRPDEVSDTMKSRIRSFWGREPLFSEITIDWMRKLAAWHTENKLHPNTLNNTDKYLRRILGQAKKEGYIRVNPFDIGYKVHEYIDPETVFLNYPERDRVFDLMYKMKEEEEKKSKYSDEYIILVYFLLGCFTGYRHSDWQAFDPHERVQEDNMIRLRAHKNKQWVVMEIGPSLQIIINEIYKIGSCRHISNADANEMLRALLKQAEVKKKIKTHVARHSFGYHCAKLGLSKQHTAHFMGVSLKVVEVYYHLTGEDLKEQTKQLAAA